ncbi:NAD(P)-dependent oxidoreductase [Bacillus sp. JJ722]|uniref:NAD(P)-dependent oxidoreductase n=1 Tax=Bacillus sp. JJ722 TaxID=3122973 RepID=UPI002FFEF62F
MNQRNTIALIGGTGKVGKHIVKKALDNNLHVRMLVRNRDKIVFSDERITIIEGNAENKDDLRHLLQECQFVINTFGQPVKNKPLYSKITRNVISIMKELQLKRYIGVTGASLHVSGDKKSIKNRIVEKAFASFYPAFIEDREIELNIIRKSDVEWTVFRLPLVINSRKNGLVKVNVSDIPGSIISNYDIASFLIQQIYDDHFIRKTPFIAN